MLEAGLVVKSIAGHDKDRFYLVVRARQDCVWIADGRMRKLEKPKCKNVRHVRATATQWDVESVKTDKRLRELLKPFGTKTAAAQEKRG